MHGDEPTGRQLTLALAEWLCGSQAHDPRAARLLDEALLYLLPTINPDGFASHRRENRSALEAFTLTVPTPCKTCKTSARPSYDGTFRRECHVYNRNTNTQLGMSVKPAQPRSKAKRAPL